MITASNSIAANSINCWVDWTCETDVGGDDTDESANFLQQDFHSLRKSLQQWALWTTLTLFPTT